MNRILMTVVLIAGLTGSSAWALFETNKELSKSATVPLENAVHAAVTAMPGKAVEVQLGKDEGRTVYKVEIIDNAYKTRKVNVDAQTMQVKIER